MRLLCRLMTASHGATDTADAMTDPKPRVTNKTGNAQQTSVVTEDASPTIELIRSGRIDPSINGHKLSELALGTGSDQQDGSAEMWRTLRIVGECSM